MTYNYKNYTFSVLSEADLLTGGDTSLSHGDKFVMPGSASTCITVNDNDIFLSGDSYKGERADDHYGQDATVDDGTSGEIYAEQIWNVKGSDGKWYKLVEIEIAGKSAPGTGDDYFAFYEKTPPAGVTLTLDSCYNVKSNFLDYKCLDAGAKGPATGTVEGNVFCDLDCDGIDDVGGTTVTKGANLLKSSDFEAGKTIYNSDGYGSWYDAGNNSGDVIQGTDHGSFNNSSSNEIFELDKGSILCQNFSVSAAGKYCLTFDVYKNSKIGSSDNDFKVKINGNTVKDVHVNSDGTVTLELDLSAGSNRIDFVSGSGVSGKGAAVDNIAIQQLTTTTGGGEPGKAGVTVKLVDLGGATVASTTTDANGDYSFGNVAVGNYKVMVVAPSGQEFTLQDVGSNDNIDSDVNAAGMSGTVSVTAGGTVTIDAGLKDAATPLGMIGGRVTYDVDDDNTENAAGGGFDVGFAGELVKLLDASGAEVARTTTDANGAYKFNDVPGGQYKVMFADKPGFKIAQKDVGTNTEDSDANSDGMTDVFTLPNGGMFLNVDLSLQDIPAPGSLSGRYFEDMNRDGLDNDGAPLSGVLVQLLDAAGNPTGATATTDSNGNYSFTGLAAGTYGVKFTDVEYFNAGLRLTTQNVDGNASDDIDSDAADLGNGMSEITGITVTAGNDTPDNDAGVIPAPPAPGSLSGRYFMDSDDDNQDNGEMGLAGIVVTLNETGATTTTDANGDYSFGGLAAGDYSVTFTDPTGVLAGKQLVTANQGPDATDSDAIGDTTSSTISGITVTAGNDTPDNDAGAEDIPTPTGDIAGTYFCDNNSNDIQDGGDTAVVGATVDLVDASGTVIRSTTTDGNGDYAFTGLPEGNYTVQFGPSGIAGKEFVIQDAGTDETVDSDVDSGGTAPVTVVSGVTADIDAGIKDAPLPQGSLSGTYFCDENDNDRFESGETVLVGQTVWLVEQGVGVVATTMTDANGDYTFTGLDAGNYRVRFDGNNNGGKEFVTADIGDDIDDSDVTTIGGSNNGNTAVISLGQGEDKANVDAGVETPAVVNFDPTPADDAGKTCADEAVKIDVLANDVDPDTGDNSGLTITQVAGQDIAEGGTVTVNGVDVMLMGGQLSFDGSGSAALTSLDIGVNQTISIDYTVSDGAGGTGTATADVEFCGTANTVASLEASLPTGDIKFQIIDENNPAPQGGEMWTMKLSQTGDVRFEGLVIQEAYCVAVFDSIRSGVTGDNIDGAPMNFGTISVLDDMSMVGSASTNLKAGVTTSTVDNMINWILNQDFSKLGITATDAEIQGAIWGLTDDNAFVAAGAGELADAIAICDLAVANGGSFVAGAGDVIGLYVDPNAATIAAGHSQPFVLGVNFDDVDCIC